jgi:hypothetical protein
MQKELFTYPLIGGKQIQGTCVHPVQLSAKFQIWARDVCGVSDRDSLAYLVCDKPESWQHYFTDEIAMLRNAAECERAIALHEMPKDFGTAIPSGKMCFAVIEI